MGIFEKWKTDKAGVFIWGAHLLSLGATIGLMIVAMTSSIKHRRAALAVGRMDLSRLVGPCRFKSVIHMDCPTCGLSRSFISFFHGDISQAVGYHQLGPVVVILIFLLMILNLMYLFGVRRDWRQKWTAVVSYFAIAVVLGLQVWWLFRLATGQLN